MKIPTLFGRTPKHQKFSFEPRFYDSKKEEMQERERRIRMELNMGNNEDESAYQHRIKGSFHTARKRSQSSTADLQANLIRIAVLLFLVILIIAYLQWGNNALYGLLIVLPLYVWIKFRK